MPSIMKKGYLPLTKRPLCVVNKPPASSLSSSKGLHSITMAHSNLITLPNNHAILLINNPAVQENNSVGEVVLFNEKYLKMVWSEE